MTELRSGEKASLLTEGWIEARDLVAEVVAEFREDKDYSIPFKQKEISDYLQRAMFEELTLERLAELRAEHGDDEVNAWLAEMMASKERV